LLFLDVINGDLRSTLVFDY